jgi:hypothetical protein
MTWRLWPCAQVICLLPPPLQKVVDVQEWIGRSFLGAAQTSASGKKRKVPVDVTLTHDGFALLPDEVRR